mgnify:CR=1 FL=1
MKNKYYIVRHQPHYPQGIRSNETGRASVAQRESGVNCVVYSQGV